MACDLDQDGQIRSRRSLDVEQDQRQTWLITCDVEMAKRIPLQRFTTMTCNCICLTVSCSDCVVSLSYHYVTNVSPIHAPPLSLNHLICYFIHAASYFIVLCLYAPTWIDIVRNEPWPMTTSRLPDAHALRIEHLPLLRELRHSSVHRAGRLRPLRPIDRSSYNWI